MADVFIDTDVASVLQKNRAPARSPARHRHSSVADLRHRRRADQVAGGPQLGCSRTPTPRHVDLPPPPHTLRPRSGAHLGRACRQGPTSRQAATPSRHVGSGMLHPARRCADDAQHQAPCRFSSSTSASCCWRSTTEPSTVAAAYDTAGGSVARRAGPWTTCPRCSAAFRTAEGRERA